MLVAAAVAAVLVGVGATTAGALLGHGNGKSAKYVATASASPSPSGTATLLSVDTEDVTLLEAGDQLVRADFATQDGTGIYTAEQLAQIADTRQKLGIAVAARKSSHTDRTEVASRSAQDRDSMASESPSATETQTPANTDPTAIPFTAEAASGTTPSAESTAETSEPATTPEVATVEDVAPEQAANTEPTDGVEDEASPAEVEQPALPTPSVEEIADLTAQLRALLDVSQSATTVVPGPPTEEEIAEQLAEAAKSTQGYANGKIPAEVLCELSFAKGERLRCDAAKRFEELNKAYVEKFGRNISVTDSYRSYASQISVKSTRGFLAAVPGTSNHGWGLAVDLSGGMTSYSSAQYKWMRENAPKFGWDNPGWARAGGSKNEPWHWEFGTKEVLALASQKTK